MRHSILMITTFLLVNGALSQKPIHDFNDLMEAFNSGKSVNGVFHYAKCKLYSDGIEQKDTIQAIGGMHLAVWEYFDSSIFKGKVPSFVTASETVLINHPVHGYVYNYVKVKIRIDNSVEITARYLRPKKFSSKFKVVMDETFKGVINDGSNDAGIYFYSTEGN